MSKYYLPEPWNQHDLLLSLAALTMGLVDVSGARSLASRTIEGNHGTHGTKTLDFRSPDHAAEPPAIIRIDVGRGNHNFSNESVTAKVGDIVIWRFFPPIHSVVHGDYEAPCVPVESLHPNIDPSKIWWSGLKRVDRVPSKEADFITFWKRINDTEPIFYYCSAPGSCTDFHMVGVINPNATHNLDKAKNGAAKAAFQLNPGEPFPSEGKPPGSGMSMSGGMHLSRTNIAVISVSVLAFLLVVGLVFFLIGKRRGKLRWAQGGHWAGWSPWHPISNSGSSQVTGVETGKRHGSYPPFPTQTPTPSYDPEFHSPQLSPYNPNDVGAYASNRASVGSPPLVQGKFLSPAGEAVQMGGKAGASMEPVELYGGQAELAELDSGAGDAQHGEEERLLTDEGGGSRVKPLENR